MRALTASCDSRRPTRLRAAAALAFAIVMGMGCDGGGIFLPTVVERPAQSVRIVSVQAYQTHQQILYRAEGEPEPGDANEGPLLLANRRTLIRAMVDPVDGTPPGEITGRLKVRASPNEDELVLESKAFILARSTADSLASSLTWELDPALVTPGLTLQVTLFESRIEVLTEDEEVVVDAPQSRWPMMGRARLRPAIAPTLHVRLVPLTNPPREPEEESREPELTDELLDRLWTQTMELYPTTNVEFDIAEPLPLSIAVDPYGDGWEEAAAEVAELYPETDGTITIGLIAPTTRRADFCPLACFQGMTHVTGMDALEFPTFGRVAVALAYDDVTTAQTFVHELGHTLGRHHAPCATQDDAIDPDFPNAEGQTGAWGWSWKTESLRPPTDHDFMSYCAPQWVNPYQTGHLLEALRDLERERRE